MSIYDFEKNNLKKYFAEVLGVTLEDMPSDDFDTRFHIPQVAGTEKKDISRGCVDFYTKEVDYDSLPGIDYKKSPITVYKGTRVGRAITVNKKDNGFEVIIGTIRC